MGRFDGFGKSIDFWDSIVVLSANTSIDSLMNQPANNAAALIAFATLYIVQSCDKNFARPVGVVYHDAVPYGPPNGSYSDEIIRSSTVIMYIFDANATKTTESE